MRTVIMILALVPALVALGHDAYLFYINQDNPIYQEGDFTRFFASLGYIWTTYHPASYQSVIESVSPETWTEINGFLTQKAFFVALAFAGAIYAIVIVLWFFGIGRYKPEFESELTGGRGNLSLKGQRALDKFEGKGKKGKRR